jgi:hypothetical protein
MTRRADLAASVAPIFVSADEGARCMVDSEPACSCNPILNRPLTFIGGIWMLDGNLTFYKHEGYHHGERVLEMDLAWASRFLRNNPPGFYLVNGSLSDPSFSWPLYAEVRKATP